jgi:hypothetical protein
MLKGYLSKTGVRSQTASRNDPTADASYTDVRQEMQMRFDYGDAAIAILSMGGEPNATRPCAVVGITRIDSNEQSVNFGHPVGTTLYTVEFGDGSEALVPEEHLSLIEE